MRDSLRDTLTFDALSTFTVHEPVRALAKSAPLTVKDVYCPHPKHRCCNWFGLLIVTVVQSSHYQSLGTLFK